MTKYLDLAGCQYLVNKIRSYISDNLTTVTGYDMFARKTLNVYHEFESISKAVLPLVTSIDTDSGGPFSYLLEEIEMPNLQRIESQSAFAGVSIKYANFPKLENLKMGAFNGCTELIEANLPNVTEITDGPNNGGEFNTCDKLQKVIVKDIQSLPILFFANCPELKTVEGFSNIKSFYQRCIENCPKLNTDFIIDSIGKASSSSPVTLVGHNSYATFQNINFTKPIKLTNNVKFSVATNYRIFNSCTVPEIIFENVNLSQPTYTVSFRIFDSCTGIKSIIYRGTCDPGPSMFLNGCNYTGGTTIKAWIDKTCTNMYANIALPMYNLNSNNNIVHVFTDAPTIPTTWRNFTASTSLILHLGATYSQFEAFQV